MRSVVVACALALVAAPVRADDLDLAILSGGSSSVVVPPGASVDYEVVGELADASGQGLALFRFDLAFDGGALSPAEAPTAAPMTHFAAPLGFNNPAGFGGTPDGGALRQVGGGQNTTNNTQGTTLVGGVVTGVALPGSPEVLVHGSLTAPETPGTYTLSLSSVGANVLAAGTTGVPVWAVEAAGAGVVTDLVVTVEAPLTGNPATLSIATGGTQTLQLDAGADNAGRGYVLLGSITGTSPGVTLPSGVVLPLNVDVYFLFTLDNPNSPVLSDSLGTLDAAGTATAGFHLPPGLPAAAIGLVVHHAYVLLSPKDFASNAVAVELTP